MEEKTLQPSRATPVRFRNVFLNKVGALASKDNKLRSFSLLDIIWFILVVYSFFPQNTARELLWDRWFDIPISYIPFLIIFFFLFVHNIYHYFRSNTKTLFIHPPIIIFALFVIYIPVQFIFLFSANHSLHLKDYFTDYAMFVFYGFCVFHALTVYFANMENAVQNLEGIIEKSFLYLFIICIVSLLRYLVYDIRHDVYFFNLFYPLGYRLFEVLFLVFFSAIVLGWYFSTGEKKYLIYFTGYGTALMLAGSRTGYVAYALIILYLLVRMRTRLFATSVGLALIFVFIVGLVIGGEKTLRRIINVKYVSVYATLNKDEKTQMRRVAYWKGCFEMFMANKMFGVGLGKENFRRNFPNHIFASFKKKHVGRPHITYLYILVSTGIIGFGILGSFILSIIKKGYESVSLLKTNKFMCEKTAHILFANFLILILQLGYQFETEPFVWMFWGLSFSWFYKVGRFGGGVVQAKVL